MIETKPQFDVFVLPSMSARRLYEQLVGLDRIKDRVLKEAKFLLDPRRLGGWDKKFHGGSAAELIALCERRTPLLLFGGDVGTGKTALAETFGDTLAREEHLAVEVHRLSLSSRGIGAVGQMTTLLSQAFSSVLEEARRGAREKGKHSKAIIMVIDEADALAQSRELSQMHHEDRAGVNTLLQGLNQVAEAHLPILVVMCTNRLDSLDPAIQRRAAAIFRFERPSEDERRSILEQYLVPLGFDSTQIENLVQRTGEPDGVGYTYSDFFQRFLPSLVLEAFPDVAIDFHLAMRIASEIRATPKFRSSDE